MQHSSLTASTVVLHCCVGLNICPFQPQKWLCSSGGWFLSIQGSSEAWKSLSIRREILSTAADPLGSLLPTSARPELSILACPCTEEQKDPIPASCAAEQRLGPHQEPAHPMQKTFVLPACGRGEREELSAARSGGLGLLGPQCWVFPHSQPPGWGCSSSTQQLCCALGCQGMEQAEQHTWQEHPAPH